MNLQDKIEEIRQKPENIRRRYVWFWTAVCMFFVFFIWVFSLISNIKNEEENSDNQDLSQKEFLEDLSEQKNQLGKEVGNIKSGISEMQDKMQEIPKENEGFVSE